jgi:glycosyltransferase involved in cell wall biosynthesis
MPSDPSLARMPGDDLTIVVPSFNEANNLQGVVAELIETFQKQNMAPHVLVVDDGSTDETDETLASLAQSFGARVSHVRHQSNRGLGEALKTGFLHAETTWLGWTPADGQFSAEDLLRLYQRREAATAVTGRVTVRARRRSDNLLRVTLSLGLRVIMRALHPHMPNFNGVMVLRRAAVDPARLVCRTGFVNMEILDRIRRSDPTALIVEDEVSVRPRRSGASKVANGRTLAYVILDLVRLRTDYLLHPQRKRARPMMQREV